MGIFKFLRVFRVNKSISIDLGTANILIYDKQRKKIVLNEPSVVARDRKTRKIIDDNATDTHMIVAHLIPDNAGAILMPILLLVLGFFVSLKVGIILIILSIVGGISLSMMTGEKEFMKIYQESLETLSSETVEYVRGIQVIKIFGISVESFKALNTAIKNYSKYSLEYAMSCKRGFVGFQWFFFSFIQNAIKANNLH